MEKKKLDAATEAEQTAAEREETAAGETWADAEAAAAAHETVTAAEEDAEEENLILKFDKPYVFEGQTYTEVDLSGLESTTAADMTAVGRAVNKKMPGLNAATLEMNLEYAQFMAQRVTKKPLEFFTRLPSKEAMKLKGIVVGFLYGGDGED